MLSLELEQRPQLNLEVLSSLRRSIDSQLMFVGNGQSDVDPIATYQSDETAEGSLESVKGVIFISQASISERVMKITSRHLMDGKRGLPNLDLTYWLRLDESSTLTVNDYPNRTLSIFQFKTTDKILFQENGKTIELDIHNMKYGEEMLNILTRYLSIMSKSLKSR